MKSRFRTVMFLLAGILSSRPPISAAQGPALPVAPLPGDEIPAVGRMVTGPAWTWNGDEAVGWLGYSAASAGDVNGDGYDDVIVGAPLEDTGAADGGMAYAFLGSADGVEETVHWSYGVDQTNAQFGYAVASAGDVNGDGYDDVIVGSWREDNGQADEGRAYVFLGSASGLEVSPDWVAESNQESAFYGISVACAGDVNDDGYDDVLVGAFFHTATEYREGRAYLYLGSEDGLSTAPAWTADGGQAEATFGRTVASAGDVNGDGYDDILVAAHVYDGGEVDEGRVFLYLGGPGGPSLAPDWTAESDQAGAFFGLGLGGAGDVDGDGFDDVVIGAPNFDTVVADAGKAYLFRGSDTGLESEASWTVESNQSAFLGWPIGAAGDVDGDGHADVILGALKWDVDLTDEGAAFIYLGTDEGLAPGYFWRAEGDQIQAFLGVSAAGAGDVNGDGVGDVIAGAFGFDTGLENAGQARVYHGARPPKVVINEVLYYPDPDSVGTDRDHEWVELYNPGPDVAIEGWTLTDRDLTVGATLPAWTFPESTYLVVHLTDGTDDGDFSDGAGHYYAGEIDVFSETMGECALYTGAQSTGTIVDFLSWSDSYEYEPGAAHDLAVAAGMWLPSEFFAPMVVGESRDMRVPASAGQSVGRDSLHTDSDAPEDWRGYGGADSYDITPGAVNSLPIIIEFDPPLSGEDSSVPTAWTVILFWNGDNDLHKTMYKQLVDLERQGSLPNVNVVVLADFAYVRPLRGKLATRPENGIQSLTQMPDELNLGSGQTLADFLKWVKANHPADKYLLSIYSHGQGWKGISWDEHGSLGATDDGLTMKELKDALADPDAPHIDVLLFHACLMGMVEVAAQIRDHVDVMVASEEVAYAYDIPYEQINTHLNTGPGTTAAEAGIAVVTSADSRLKAGKFFRGTYTWSAIDCGTPLDDLIADVDGFAVDLTAGLEDVQTRKDPSDNVQWLVMKELQKTWYMEDANFIDLYDFASRINSQAAIPNAYKTRAQAIMAGLTGGTVVLKEVHGPYHGRAHGLTIYFPLNQTDKTPPYVKQGLGIFNGGDLVIQDRPFDDPWPSFLPTQPTVPARYARDPDDCSPVWTCDTPDPNAGNHPSSPTPDFDFAFHTNWDEFLHRFYEPVADAGGSFTAAAGTPFTLDATGTSDVNGAIWKYCWDVNAAVDDHPEADCSNDDWDRDCVDEENDDCTLSGVTANTSFPAPGTYVVTLSVISNHHLVVEPHHPGGATHFEADQDEIVVTVLDPASADDREVHLTDFKRLGRNPVSESAVLSLSLAERGRVSVDVYDVAGRRIRKLIDGEKGPGRYPMSWDGRDDQGRAVASGAYYAVMRAGGFRRVLDLHLVR